MVTTATDHLATLHAVARALEEARTARDAAIRGALADGYSPTIIAQCVGLSRQRIYQLGANGRPTI